MRVSPVAGTPVIPQAPSTGMSAEKLQKIKSIAMGALKEETPTEEVAEQDKKALPTTKSIKMQTNKNPETIAAPQVGEGGAIPLTENKQENAVPDTDAQTKPIPEATQEVSPQIAALAKQKRALQIKERELADKEKALEAKSQGRAELEQRVKSGQALSVLEELGITYDQLTNELLGKQSAPDLTQIEQKILKSVDERLASKDTAQEEAVFTHMKRNVDKLTYSSDNYPFVKADKAQDKVMELIKRAWREDGEVLDEEEALGLIESELKEKAQSFAKILKGPEPTTPVAAEPPQKQPASQPAGIKTLTNKDSARVQSNRRQRALAAFLGQK